jgi:hypothetical protein
MALAIVMSIILFQETQRFRQVWIWLVIILVLVVTIVNIRLPQQGANMGAVRFISIAIPAVIAILFYLFRLETKIDDSGMYYKFYPFHLMDNKLEWNLIDRVYVRKYQPIFEYGGWGIRGFGKNRALNVSGNMGIQIELKNGKKLLLGTQKPEEAESVIIQLSQQGKIAGNNMRLTTKDRF